MALGGVRNRARGIYDCHCHPYLSHVRFGMVRRHRAARWVVLLPQGDPPHSNDNTTTENLADNTVLDRLTVNLYLQVRPDPGELNVTPTNNQLGDTDQPQLHPPCRLGIGS